MPRPFELNKTWIVGPSRGTTTFNAPGSITIDYGRHVAKVSGRGGSGNSPVASAWVTNYNTNYNNILLLYCYKFKICKILNRYKARI